jgi:hypothetical protein
MVVKESGLKGEGEGGCQRRQESRLSESLQSLAEAGAGVMASHEPPKHLWALGKHTNFQQETLLPTTGLAYCVVCTTRYRHSPSYALPVVCPSCSAPSIETIQACVICNLCEAVSLLLLRHHLTGRALPLSGGRHCRIFLTALSPIQYPCGLPAQPHVCLPAASGQWPVARSSHGPILHGNA